MRFTNKNVLITGGTSGIGLAAARQFLAEGAQVAIIGRDQTKLDEVAQELGANVLAIQADTANVAAMEQAMQTIANQWGHLDSVFANAGISGATPLGGTSLDTFEEVLRVNVTGVFLTVQAALPYLNDGASVILIGSAIATLGWPERSAYAASKGAVRSMARSMAAELSPRGIRVNVVVPGAVHTPIWSTDNAPDVLATLDQRLSQSIPMQRLGEADEVANVVLFLASDEASYIQGAEFVVDGGATGTPAGAPIYRDNS